ncbi:MAG: tRNA (adenosine(37)-N6)-threonylcarbamoyltransferase complex dimerization subunit type 1 TsaB [Acutalibacteraceae bacterium]
MIILALDASASPASAALVKDGQLIGEYFINIKCTHSQTLMPLVENLLATTETDKNAIDVFAVNVGPGSFTGVRIGVSAVKGMAMALNKPCAAVSTLESMAHMALMFDGIVCAVMDARCSQVYNALFEIKNGTAVRLTEDRALSIGELKNELEQNYSDRKIMVMGDGTEVVMRTYDVCPNNIIAAPMNIRFQHASGTAFAAEKKAEKNDLTTAAALMPTYLRLPQAQRELLKKQEAEKQKEN